MGLLDLAGVEDVDQVDSHVGGTVGVRVVGFVAGAVATGVDQDQAIVSGERFDVAVFVPCLDAVAKAREDKQRGSVSLDPVVDTDITAGNIWHRPISPFCQPLGPGRLKDEETP